jgi:hypothetical protein
MLHCRQRRMAHVRQDHAEAVTAIVRAAPLI